MSSPYKTIAFHSFGCKLNFAEMSTISSDFTINGYSKVSFNDRADVYVINTCSVTENANRKARKKIRQARSLSPNSIIVIIGCYAQLNPDEISKIPGVNLVVGTEQKFNLIKYVETALNDRQTVVVNSNIEKSKIFFPSYSREDRVRTFLKIQDGCNYPCSYCTIPLARGSSRSGMIKDVIYNAKKIASNGVKEIILTGVNIGEFGSDTGETFFDLIKGLDKIKNIKRYRISSIEPNLLTENIVKFIANSRTFLPHFHIPLQSGSNEILKSMKRRYLCELFIKKIKLIQFYMPDACIGSDVIVGYPGETDEDFNKTIRLIKLLNLSYLHVFSYSDRKDTKSEKIIPKVPIDKLKERSETLRNLSQNLMNKYHKKNNGYIRDVLFEDYSEGRLTGLTDNYIRTSIRGNKNMVNQIVPIKLKLNRLNSFIMNGSSVI